MSDRDDDMRNVVALDVARRRAVTRRQTGLIVGRASIEVGERLGKLAAARLKSIYPPVEDFGQVGSMRAAEVVRHPAQSGQQEHLIGSVMPEVDLRGDEPSLDQQRKSRLEWVHPFRKVVHVFLHLVVGASDGRDRPGQRPPLTAPNGRGGLDHILRGVCIAIIALCGLYMVAALSAALAYVFFH